MIPHVHAKLSVKRYGGKIEDYLPIHDWMDSTKSSFADVRHRAILHNAFGPYIAEQVFGHVITNSDGKEIGVRMIVEDHISEDFGGKIPSIQEWLSKIPMEDWMTGKGQKRFLDLNNLND